MQDTYWLTNGMLLRTHTSATRSGLWRPTACRCGRFFPGRCFRNEAIDASHETPSTNSKA